MSPCDRLLARRRRAFARDWILVLIALGLMVAAGAFRPPLSRAGTSPPASAALLR